MYLHVLNSINRDPRRPPIPQHIKTHINDPALYSASAGVRVRIAPPTTILASAYHHLRHQLRHRHRRCVRRRPARRKPGSTSLRRPFGCTRNRFDRNRRRSCRSCQAVHGSVSATQSPPPT